jgi:hypothetical protein
MGFLPIRRINKQNSLVQDRLNLEWFLLNDPTNKEVERLFTIYNRDLILISENRLAVPIKRSAKNAAINHVMNVQHYLKL